jgi:hypothetical protein
MEGGKSRGGEMSIPPIRVGVRGKVRLSLCLYDDSLMIHIITLRIQALSLVESDDLLGDRRTE